MKYLVIVESPSKARTIERYLGKGYRVLSSMGHIRDLPKKTLGVDLEDAFEPSLVVTNKKQATLLRKEAKAADVVYLATDNDREGEAIAFDLLETLKTKREKTPYVRVVFNEITKSVILKAIEHPTEIDDDKVQAQRARRILDRLVGYLVSPLLSKALSGNKFEGLSAGRVQSVALRFICDREQEIQAFKPEEYWSLYAKLSETKDAEAFVAKLYQIEGKKPQIKDKQTADDLMAELRKRPFTVDEVKPEKQTRKPPAPFITSTLQQTASSQLSFSPKRTMQLAQQLYEGIELGQGPEGLITYMRTDSLRLSPQAVEQARSFIEAEYGKNYLVPKPRAYKNKKKSQDAHEAVRPTNPRHTPESIKRYLNSAQFRLYQLVWQRFMATQMADAQYERTKVKISAGECAFRSSVSHCTFDGFLKVMPLPPLQDEGATLPQLSDGQTLALRDLVGEQHFTEPPRRFSEASLIKELEAQGIGRPSTYASIVTTIQDRNYVVKQKSQLAPTLLGFIVTDFLKKHFPITIQIDFTANMEDDMDLIAEGKLTRLDVLNELYQPLAKRLDSVQSALKEGTLGFRTLTDHNCETCGSPMEVRFWKGSRYLGCSRYPDCKQTVDFPEDVEFEYHPQQVIVQSQLKTRQERQQPLEDHPCPACGAPMALKQGPYGRFYGCTRYPECKTTEPVVAKTPCPTCGSPLIERYSKKRRQTFWGCKQYPACTFTTNAEPLRACPDCEEGVLVVKDEGTLACTNKVCGHLEAVQARAEEVTAS